MVTTKFIPSVTLKENKKKLKYVNTKNINDTRKKTAKEKRRIKGTKRKYQKGIVNLSLSVISLNVNGLNFPIK